MVIYEVAAKMILTRILTAAAFLVVASFAIGYSGRVVRKVLSRKFEEETVLNLMESISKGLL
ncbi:MAG: hypothetical protein ABEJ87_04050 [Candidatus Nanohalobium sp.]